MEHAATGRASRRGRRYGAVLALAMAATMLMVSVASAADLGFQDFSYTGTTAPTGEKPQSKLWFNAGQWWGAMYNSATSRFEIYRLDWGTQQWSTTGVSIESRGNVRQDVVWDGTHLYVLSGGIVAANTDPRVTSAAGKLYSFSYKNGSYSKDAGFPVTVIPDGGAEAMVLNEEQSTGRLWVTYTANLQVLVAHSTTSPKTWVAPYVLPVANAANLTSDDISSIVPFNGKIGVMWGNQTPGLHSYLFAVHANGAGDTAADWTVETAMGPAPGHAWDPSIDEWADDHINLKSVENDPAGQVFASVKTSLDQANQPLEVLLVRKADGTWTRHTISTAQYQQSRGIVLLDMSNRDLYIFNTAPCCSGGTIYYKKVNLNSLTDTYNFPDGLGTPFISLAADPKTNNATSTKQNLDTTSNLLVAVGDDSTHFYAHNFINLTPVTIPDTVIDTSPPATDGATAATFTFHSTPAGATFECRLDGAAYAACTSPTTVSGLTVGSHTFSVRATNSAGTDPTPATWGWNVVVLPDTTIDTGPPASDPATSASLTFHSTPAGATFECRLDAANFAACTSPATYAALTAGSHTVSVRAVNSSGADATPATRTWSVVAPDTTITGGPPATDSSTVATLAFTSTSPQATFQCKRDTGAYAACTSPFSYTGLASGSHTASVRAVTSAGTDATAATWSWTVLAPDTTITGGPPASDAATSPSFTFTSTSPQATFQCSRDGATYGTCTSPKTYTGLTAGSHTVNIRAVTSAGTDATPASWTWTITVPDTTITGSPSVNDTSPSPSFAYTSDSPQATFRCRLDGAVFATCTSPTSYSGLALGSHTFDVKAVTSAGTDATPATWTWTISTLPDTAIDFGPPATDAATTPSFAFHSLPAGLAFECRLDAAAFAACTSPQAYTGLSAGSHTFSVRAVNAAGADPTPASSTWTVVAPDTTIVTGPPATDTSTAPSFTFTSTSPQATFECRMDGGSYAACTSPKAYSSLALGSHTFNARAFTSAGTDATPAAWTWTIALPPDTAIDSHPPASDAATTATFSFHSVPSGATFECSLDAAAYAACTTPTAYSGVTAGSHTFGVRAVTAAGPDPSPATYTWTVVAPDTTIATGPSLTDTSTTATFTFTSSSPQATFECSLDSAAFAACTSPASYTGLTLGSHAFDVRAVSSAGTDATPAHWGWTVVAVSDTTIDTWPLPNDPSTTVTFTFHSTPAGATFECSLDGPTYTACTSPKTYTALTAGSHTFGVRAVNAAGPDPSPPTYTWTVIAPDTTMVTGPPAIDTSTTATLAFTSSSGQATFECSLDSAAFAACTSPKTYTALTLADHTFDVRAVSSAGTDATAAHWGWTVLALPDTTIDSGPSGGSDPSTTATFAFSSPSAGVTFECSLDALAYAACTSPHTYSGLTAGSHTFAVRAVNAGGPDPTPATSSWTVETVPDTTIDSGPAGSDVSTSATFTFSSAPAGATFECSLDNAAFAACTSPATYTGLTLGDHTFDVQATNTAGTDATPAHRSWTVVEPPDTTITGGPSSSDPSTSATFTFSSPSPDATFECRLDGPTWAACLSGVTYTGLAAGPHTFSVRAVDAGGPDPTPATWDWTVFAPPETAIDSGPTGSGPSTSAAFTFSSPTAGATFECDLDGSGFAACTSPASYTGLTVGSHTFSVRAVNDAGSDPTPASRTWTVDAPDTTITGGPSATDTSTTATFIFNSSSAQATFECSLDSATYGACTSPVTAGGLAAGGHTFDVRAVTSAGTDASPSHWVWTVIVLPDTTIDTAPADGDTSTSATFTVHSTPAGATFECRFDGAASFTACTSPATYTGLALGSHTLLVQAVNSDGTDPTPATWTWTIWGPTSFYDGFESGNLSAWTAAIGTGTTDFAGVVTGDTTAGIDALRLTAGSGTGSFADVRKVLSANQTNVTVTADVKITTEGASGGNVPILRLFDPSGVRVINFYRQNLSGAALSLTIGPGSTNRLATTGTLPLNSWGHFELHVITAGTGVSTVEIRLNGTLIFSTTTAGLATTGIKTVQFGNETKAQAFSLLADEVRIAWS